jgi:hypothetical protein
MTAGAAASHMPEGSPTLDLAVIVTGLDGPPRPDLDPFLDAATACFARHGHSAA